MTGARTNLIRLRFSIWLACKKRKFARWTIRHSWSAWRG